MKRLFVIPLALALGCASSSLVIAQDVQETFLPSGITAKTGGYSPVRAVMDLEADSVKVPPEGLSAPKFGEIKLGDKTVSFILDEPEEGEAKLFIDANGDGDLTNDPATEWTSEEQGEFKMFNGSAKIELGKEQVGVINLYRFDPTDPRRAALANTLLYYPDFGYEFTFSLDDTQFSTFTAGSLRDGQPLPIDRDGNGKVSRNFEMVAIGSDFNFTGTTYKFSLNDGKLTLAKATTELPMMQLPPNLEIGQNALEFSAETMQGEKIQFPKHYAGKIVMLDMWATWCGPCIGEIPHMKEAYTNWHDQGFEILGVSLDSPEMTEKINEFLTEHEIEWPQIYEGKGWDIEIARQHDVSGIPFVLLIDGDSGKILATARQLRGAGLSEFIGEQIEKKKGAESNSND